MRRLAEILAATALRVRNKIMSFTQYGGENRTAWETAVEVPSASSLTAVTKIASCMPDL